MMQEDLKRIFSFEGMEELHQCQELRKYAFLFREYNNLEAMNN